MYIYSEAYARAAGPMSLRIVLRNVTRFYYY